MTILEVMNFNIANILQVSESTLSFTNKHTGYCNIVLACKKKKRSLCSFTSTILIYIQQVVYSSKKVKDIPQQTTNISEFIH